MRASNLMRNSTHVSTLYTISTLTLCNCRTLSFDVNESTGLFVMDRAFRSMSWRGDFPLVHSINDGCEAQPDSYPMGAGVHLTEDKAGET
jgi:hypothetical protein